MKVLDSTHREDHFTIDNPEIREHYVHETRLTSFNPAFDLGWKTQVKTQVLNRVLQPRSKPGLKPVNRVS